MREIKFRAWDVEDKEMVDDIYTGTDDFTDMLNETFKYWQDEELGNLKLMQFTGLKDKNGKEIYEGDVLNVKGICFSGVEVVEDMVEWLQDYGYGLEEQGNYQEMEVVGNIYQNPGLVKKRE